MNHRAAALNGWRRPTAALEALQMRACSDCTEYAPEDQMISTPAGNVICPKCNNRRKRLAAERDQLTFFGQKGLF